MKKNEHRLREAPQPSGSPHVGKKIDELAIGHMSMMMQLDQTNTRVAALETTLAGLTQRLVCVEKRVDCTPEKEQPDGRT